MLYCCQELTWSLLQFVRVSGSRLFFFNVTAPTEIYTLSLHDALPISGRSGDDDIARQQGHVGGNEAHELIAIDRKSTRLNSSHQIISYAVFCLKKKNCPSRRASASCSRTSSPPPRRAVSAPFSRTSCP